MSKESTDSPLKMRKSPTLLKDEETKKSSLLIEGVEETTSEIPNLGADSREIFVELPMKVMPTLPGTFKSLVDIPIDIENENREPHNIIELLGRVLGVSDYTTNMASFWFLDFIALQVLQKENKLDSDGRSIMVSWLAGEMKLIQEKNLTRDAFFQQITDIFLNNSEELERGHSLLHWDLMMKKNNKEDIAVQEDMEEKPKERAESAVKTTKRRISSRSSEKKSAIRKKISDNALRRGKRESEKKINENGEDVTAPKINPQEILDVIIEATYCMYGDNFHYALIVAAFVKPVLLDEYTLPYTLRVPRPLRMYDVEKQEKKKIITKGRNSLGALKGKETDKKRTKPNTKPKKKSKDLESIEAAPKPPTPVILTEDEVLAKRREFILPLMESNEALSILEAHREANSSSKNVKGQKQKL